MGNLIRRMLAISFWSCKSKRGQQRTALFTNACCIFHVVDNVIVLFGIKLMLNNYLKQNSTDSWSWHVGGSDVSLNLEFLFDLLRQLNSCWVFSSGQDTLFAGLCSFHGSHRAGVHHAVSLAWFRHDRCSPGAQVGWSRWLLAVSSAFLWLFCGFGWVRVREGHWLCSAFVWNRSINKINCRPSWSCESKQHWKMSLG